MTKEEKKKLLVELEENGMYHTALQLIDSDADRRQAKAFVDDIYINLIDSLSSIVGSRQEIKPEDEGSVIPNE